MTEKRFLELAKECGVTKTIWIGKTTSEVINFELQSYRKLSNKSSYEAKFVHGRIFFDKESLQVWDRNEIRIQETPKEIAMLYVAWLKENK